jgi:hypothetical protein
MGILSQRDEVLALIEKLVELNRPNLRLCITGRPEVEIRMVLEPLTPNQMCLHNQSGQKEDIIDLCDVCRLLEQQHAEMAR